MGPGLEQGLRAAAPAWLWWLLLALAWCASLQVRPLLDPDEGRYAEIPREMLASGDWVTPRFNDLKYFEKPPLQYWATAAIYAVVGLHEWSSRLWSVGLAFACLALVFAWTGRLFGRDSALGALTALGVSPYFLVVGHLNLLDGAFTFWLTAAVLAFTLAQSAPPRSSTERNWMLAAWALAALAVLSKGIVVLVLAGGTLILYTLLQRDLMTWRRLHALPGLALFLLLAAPWFVAVSLRNPSFPGFFFVHEHFARFLTTVHQRVEPWWFFLPLLLAAVVPWLVPLARGARAAWEEGAGGVPAGAFRPRRFLLLYAALTLVFFSASGSKLAPYILPMVPALAALTGAATRDPERLARHATRVGAVFVVFVAAGLLLYSARRNSYVPHEALNWALAASAVSLAALAARPLLRRWGASTVLVAVAAASLGWQFLLCEYTVIPPARSARGLVDAVRPFIDTHTALYSVGQYRETISPYLGRTLQLAGYEGELRFGLDEEPSRRMSTAQFAARWSAGGPAVAFFDPGVWDTWRRRGLPGRVIAADNYTVAVSRP
ncbi:MAG TPA: phospholipid carrier-dependent glycosyltransferase [Steroidobacteraceae bacterium]|nr:phospholipid carrier-dependent glycosyltransferase [Steroidobacteraceae bacterium]